MTRRHQRFNNQASPTLTIYFSADPKALEDISPDEHGFREDVVNGIVPYFMYSERPTLSAVLEGDEAEVSPILKDLGSDHAYDLTEQLCDAISEVARAVSYSGRGVFEICRDEQGILRFVTIPNRGLWILPFVCFQVIPKRDRERLKRRFNVVRTSKLWVVKMPRKLGGHRGFVAILRHLRFASPLGPNFYRKDFVRFLRNMPFNLSTYKWEMDVFQEVITRRWHWDRRDTSGEEATDMYYMYKKFAFRAAQCELRDHIIGEINRLFGIVGIAAKIRLKDEKTPADFMEARRKFMNGEMQLKEALKFCRR